MSKGSGARRKSAIAATLILIWFSFLLARIIRGGALSPLARRVVFAGIKDDFSEGYWPERSEAAIEQLALDQSPNADEALMIVSRCYYGAHNGEMVAIAIESRGKRMLPLLSKYEQHHWYESPPCAYPVDPGFDAIRQAILRGEKWEE